MLPLAERLRRNTQFQQVFREGQSFSDGSGLVSLHMLRREADVRHCGFTASKKIGNAVVRNRVKRRLREAYRACLPQLGQGFWLVVVARSRASRADHAALARALETALAKAGLLGRDAASGPC